MHRSGFTLVELSIVLVIIGLLTGGVLTGQSLIRAAELRSVTEQYSRYMAGIQTFRDKYFAIPGDMTNATAYWGIAGGSTGNDSSCYNVSSTDAKTCNGNGDGQLLISSGSDERFRFWQQLANAGLIEGSYIGLDTGAGATVLNAPRGRITSSLWYAQYWGPLTGQTNMFDGQYGNAMMVGAILANQAPIAPLFKPEDAYNIDQKMDDGKPATGKVVMIGTFSACTDTNASATLAANYLLTNTAPACSLLFRQQF